jgi:hypothetical protein
MIFLLILIAANVFLLSRITFFPYPELFVYPYLTNHGLLPYKNIFDQHFPGLMFFPINLNNLGMVTPEIARYWQYGLVIIVQILLFFIARKIFNSSKKAILVNLVFLAWQPFFEGWVLWIDSFLPLFLLPAFYFSYEAWKNGKAKSIFLSGLFLGIGLVFKQVVAPLAAVVFVLLFLRKRNVKDALWFLIGFLPFPLLMLEYIVSKGIFADFWYWTVIFNLTTFAQYGKLAPTFSELFRVSSVYGFSIFALINKKSRSLAVWIGIFALGALFSSNARFDFVHFQPSLPFICLLTVMALEFALRKAKFLIPIYIIGSSIFLFTFYKGNLGNKVFFFGNSEKRIVMQVQKLSGPNDKIFAFGPLPHIYQMADRLPPGNVFVFQFPWFMMKAEDRVLAGLINDPPRVVIRDLTAEVDDKNLISFMPKISDYVKENYKVIDKIDSTEIMIKK